MSASLLATSYGLLAPSSASADQLSALKAHAQSVASQIQSLGNQEAALAERYDGASLALQTDKQKVAQAAAQVAVADAAANKAKQTLQTEAVDAYIHNGTAGASGTASLGNASLGNADQSLLRAEYVSSLTNNESDAQDQYHLASLQAATAKGNLEATQASAQQQVVTLNNDRQQVSATQSQLQGVYNQDQGQIAHLVAQIQAQQAAAAQAAATAAANARAAAAQAAATAAANARAAAAAAAPTALVSHTVAAPVAVPQATPATPATPAAAPQAAAPQAAAPVSSVSSSSGNAVPAAVSNPVPPAGAGASGAVAAAETRLGDPYVWGAAGPSTFDCSGLVQWAYAQVGISLPHYSGAQYNAGVKISMSQLEPGDLVFFADPGEHVAIYIGGGQVIEAPYTGAVVHIVPMYSEFVQAVRIA